MRRSLWAVLGVALAVGCRPTPYTVASIVSYKARDDAGEHCYRQCQSSWHGCAGGCGGPSTSVVIGVGPIAVGQHRSPATCREDCRAQRDDCLAGCPGVEQRVRRVRYCPEGPGYCEEPDPASPTLKLPLYCRGPDGRLLPCE